MKKIFSITGIVYLTIVIILLPYLGNYADNPDTFQYIAIAKKYLHLDWAHAINGYWSPLISWLLVVPLAVFKDSITAFKMLQVVIGIFTLYHWCQLLSASSLKDRLKYFLTFLSIPFLISYSLLNCTPDLLFTGMVMWLMNIIIQGNITTDPAIAFKTGVVGSFLYFTKAFGLPLFVAITVAAIIFERAREKTNFRTVVMIYAVFTGLCLVWIWNISIHYGEFTISKAAEFNRSLNIETLLGNEELPVLGSGIIKPEDGNFSAWEAPGEYFSSNHSGPFLEIFKRNILSIYYFDFRNQIGIIFLLLLAMYILRKGKELLTDKWVIILLTTMLFVYGGYSLILVHSRYLWINTFILLALSTLLIQRMINNGYFRMAVYSVLFLLAVKRPLKEIFFITDKNYSATQLITSFAHPFKTLSETYKPDLEIHNSIKAFHKIKLPKTNFASLKPASFSRDTYTTSMRIAESLDAVYFGEIKPPMAEFGDVLKKKQIDYLIAYEDIPSMTPVFLQKESRIHIFLLKN